MYASLAVPRRKLGNNDERPTKPNVVKRLFRWVEFKCTGLTNKPKLLEEYKNYYPHDTRKLLDKVNYTPIPLPQQHTHSFSGGLRTGVARGIEDTIKLAGYIPYSISKAKRDIYDGNRLPFFEKDLSQPFICDQLTSNHCIYMIDVDYYVDMNEILKIGNPVMVYTFDPTQAAINPKDRKHDYFYTINDNFVEYSVSGGGEYRHRVWNYSGDTISVIDKYKNLIVYDIVQHRIAEDENRKIVSFTPTVSVPYPFYEGIVRSEPLKYKEYLQGEINVVSYEGNLSTSTNGKYDVVTIDNRTYDAICVRQNLATKPTISDIERFMLATRPNDPTCAVDASLLKTGAIFQKPVVTTTVAHYQPAGPLITEDGKEVGNCMTKPLVEHPNLFANRSLNSDKNSIQERVTKLRNDNDPKPSYKQYAKEFVEFVVPANKIGHGAPTSHSDVNDRQQRNLQKMRFELCKHELTVFGRNAIKAFNKAESQGACKPARNISQVTNTHQIGYSCFTLAFKDNVLKHIPWYTPCKTPGEISAKVQEVSSNGVFQSDFSKFDAHHSRFTNSIVDEIYMRWFAKPYRNSLSLELKRRLAKGRTSTGIPFDPLEGIRSGCPDTSDRGTMVNALLSYVSLRDTGLNAVDAWSKLGCYYGDDALNRRIENFRPSFERVCLEFGFPVDVEEVLPGKAVTFLSRVFPSPQTSLSSHCLPSVLAKLHLTTSNLPTEQALSNKAAGYLVTDSVTPIVGAWCLKAKTLDTKNLHSSEEWRIKQGPWIQADINLIRDSFVGMLEMTSKEVSDIEEMIRNVKSVDELPEGFIKNPAYKHKVQAVLDGQVVGPLGNTVTNKPNLKPETSKCQTTQVSPVKTQTFCNTSQCRQIGPQTIHMKTSSSPQWQKKKPSSKDVGKCGPPILKKTFDNSMSPITTGVRFSEKDSAPSSTKDLQNEQNSKNLESCSLEPSQQTGSKELKVLSNRLPCNNKQRKNGDKRKRQKEKRKQRRKERRAADSNCSHVTNATNGTTPGTEHVGEEHHK